MDISRQSFLKNINVGSNAHLKVFRSSLSANILLKTCNHYGIDAMAKLISHIKSDIKIIYDRFSKCGGLFL